jgi:hypothetical protein
MSGIFTFRFQVINTPARPDGYFDGNIDAIDITPRQY